MGVPSFQQLMLPTLQTIGRRYDEISISGLEDEVSKALRITLEDRQLRLPSGNQTLFANRLNWARSYLSKAGLIELPRRGYCRATDRGRELLAEGMSEIDLGTLERYPEFVPLCRSLRVRRRVASGDGLETLTAQMTVAYKMFEETFTSRVTLDRPHLRIMVEYLDGPFTDLDNRWTFRPLDEDTCEVEFFIAYEFRSRTLGFVMGAVFERAFRRFADAFEQRADSVFA